MKKPLKKMERYKTVGIKIAGGNSTLLVEGCPMNQREAYARRRLEQFEQVGFIETTSPESGNEPDIPATMTMMGGELSVNGTLAFAWYLGQKEGGVKKGELRTSGLNSLVRYRSNGEVTASFTMRPKVIRDREIVLFEGIGYVCVENPGPPNEDLLRGLAKEFKLPAFGIAGYSGDHLTPYVYVEETDSLVPETACGSGSIALNIVKGFSKIVQPTGQRISVTKTGDRFTVSAKVAKMRG